MDNSFLCNTLHFKGTDSGSVQEPLMEALVEGRLDEAARTGLLKRLLTDIISGEFMDFREELLQFAESGKFEPKIMDGINALLVLFDNLEKEANRVIGYLPTDSSKAPPKVQMNLGLERKQ